METIKTKLVLRIENLNDAIKSADFISVKDKTGGFEFRCRLNLSARDRQILLAGGLLNYTKEHRIQ